MSVCFKKKDMWNKSKKPTAGLKTKRIFAEKEKCVAYFG